MTSTTITVIGLGSMGSALARAFLTAGHEVTVWNRTPARAEPLRDLGAAVAADVRSAVTASPLVVLSLLDDAAVAGVLEQAGDLTGRTVVNLTSTTPEDARTSAERTRAAGARAVDGTVMVPTPLVGTDDAYYLLSGDADAAAEHAATLAALGGEQEFVGTDPGLAAALDLGMLDVFFTGMTAFLHAASLVGADGVRATAFVPYARRMLDLLQPTLDELASNTDSGRHPGAEDNLAMELAALEHIVGTSRARGVDPALPAVTRDLVAAAVERGHGKDGFSRVVDLLRAP